MLPPTSSLPEQSATEAQSTSLHERQDLRTLQRRHRIASQGRPTTDTPIHQRQHEHASAKEEERRHGGEPSRMGLLESGAAVLLLPAHHLGALVRLPDLLARASQVGESGPRLRGRDRALAHGLLELGHLLHDIARGLQGPHRHRLLPREQPPAQERHQRHQGQHGRHAVSEAQPTRQLGG